MKKLKRALSMLGQFCCASTFVVWHSSAATVLDWTEKGLTWENSDQDVQLTLGGRLHVDWLASGDEGIHDDVDIRRARITLNSKLYHHWQAVLDYDVGGTGIGWRNVWLGYGSAGSYGGPGWGLRAGHFINAMSTEELTSSNHLLFVERSVINTLAAGYRTGAEASYSDDTWLLRGGYYWQGLDKDFGTTVDRQGTGGKGPVLRAVWSLRHEAGERFQLAGSVQQRWLNSDSNYRVRSRPEAGLTDLRLLDTGALLDVDETLSLGGELLWQQGPWSLEVEYLRQNLQRSASPDSALQGAYAQLAYVLTGEQRSFSQFNRTLGEVRPRHDWGAITLALRWSFLDLDHADVAGGEQQDWTVGLNWAITPNVRILSNYVRARAFGSALERRVDLFESRFQLSF